MFWGLFVTFELFQMRIPIIDVSISLSYFCLSSPAHNTHILLGLFAGVGPLSFLCCSQVLRIKVAIHKTVLAHFLTITD
jgi:hypothetical protein